MNHQPGIGIGMSSSIGMVPIPIPGILFVKIPGIGTIPIPVSVSVWISERYRIGGIGGTLLVTNRVMSNCCIFQH